MAVIWNAYVSFRVQPGGLNFLTERLNLMKMLNTRKMLIMLGCLSTLFASGCTQTVFRYKMATLPDDGKSLAFYTAPLDNGKLTNAAGTEVRNVIVCIGDGMGFEHVALSRLTAGAPKLWMETLPVAGEMTTRSANKKITDSAASGTALACGVKTNNGMIGMTPDKTQYSTILELLAQKGWKTGLVATSQITHATPASYAAHVVSRGNQKGIAPQMLANRVDVMFGGGQKYWLPKSAGGIRDDKQDVLAQARRAGYQVIATRDELAALTKTPALGLFGKDGLTTAAPEPTLAEMSGMAINLLSRKNKQGFFLMIEGSQIDWAAHANDADRVIRQTLLFDMAVREAIEFARRDGHTLVIVTADHETGGLTVKSDNAGGIKAKWSSGGHTEANVPVYAFGPGAEKFAGRIDNTDLPKRIAELTGVKQFPIKKTEM